MRPSTVYSLGALSLVIGGEAADVFAIPFAKVPPSPSQGVGPGLEERANFDTPYLNRLPIYVVDIFLGTPPQKTQIQLDTGSSDLVVETFSSDLCTAEPLVCSGSGAYNANASSTYDYLTSDLVIAYGGGDGATGDYAKDVFSIGGKTLTGFEFGIMYKTTVREGILGVGYTANEFGSQLTPPREYPNLPVALVNAGYIKSRAFSIYLNDDQNPTGGVLLFGGVDTEKYCGPLSKIPLVVDDRQPSLGIIAYYVTLEGVSATNGGVHVDFPAGDLALGSVVLDSGTTYTFIPSNLAQQIYNLVGATYDAAISSVPTIPCSAKAKDITINFKFATITINVPVGQFVVFPDDTQTTCAFGLVPGNDGSLLGDTFLSSAYVVYDPDNNVVFVAQAKFNSVKENILQIQKGPDGVPHPNGDCDGVPTTTTSTTTKTSTTTISTTTKTSTATKKTSTTTTKPKTSTTTKKTTTKKTTTKKTTTKKTTAKPTMTKTSTTSKKTTMATTKKPTGCSKRYHPRVSSRL
ncbi:Candidapepsin [Dactylellina cionopaga]|nr:Candidapepsin [Dactylellina cionopaga]